MSETTEQFRVLAAGCSAAMGQLFEHPSLAARFRLHSQAQGADIIADVDALAPDLILIDADGTEPSALELCRALKDHPATLLLPVVIVSGGTGLQMAAFAAGADDFLSGPVADELLLTRLEALARSGCRRRSAAADARTDGTLRDEQLQAIFRRYLSPRLADRILGSVRLNDGPAATADIRTRAVVMFADLRGFTRISERLSPHEVVPLLNEYFSLLTEITFQHEGTVFHMAGDCLMVGFGVPFEQSDSPERAVSTAREMLDRFSDLAESWRTRHNIETGLGIGINEGDVVAGNVGSAMFMNYTIIGDAVNIASRLCQRARAGEMVLSSALKQTLDSRGHFIDAVELPAMTLRGRSTPIDIFCVPIDKRLHILEPQPVCA